MCQLIGFRVKFTVCQPLVLKHGCNSVRASLNLSFKKLMNTSIPWKVDCGVIPMYQQLLPLCLGQEWQR
jgi:hypothetical protein